MTDAERVKRLRETLQVIRPLALIGADHPQFVITVNGDKWTGNQVGVFDSKTLAIQWATHNIALLMAGKPFEKYAKAAS